MRREGGSVRRAGMGMMLLFWAAFIGLGSWWFHGFLEAQRNPNAHLVNAVSGADEPIVLERNRSGHFVATGRINGEPIEFLLDTGATYVAVPLGFAERLGLERAGSAWFNTANGRVRGDLTWLDEVSLGGFSATEVRGSISPGLEGEVALLGMSFLNRFDIEIRDSRMVLRPAGQP
ncbi:TIGR02281 family clan AA aspartic protease [Billgrantia tianxiuensis]|jgi:aspartyl protease family protein|uniref:TIGR02281 family clan AA aspartic protease n=1 Tax=Billgrantia tianxiuensis TaxID=2497861 RepID=A0A6I6SLP0_9GAMM|nr:MULTISPECIES: TIGR02281 family clan AA aspartic protease [Halomonas]MCE8035959.1 TIGR02281 family clan AA aspartic protease [Halomonas sp. MCCC 1A11057]QHC51549.1 TIGR02281 family clan AA aspartic protease [Halomonas tianxiuensis]